MENEHAETEGERLRNRALYERTLIPIARELAKNLRRKGIDSRKYFNTLEWKPDQTAKWYPELVREISERQQQQRAVFDLYREINGDFFELIWHELINLEKERGSLAEE